MCAQSDKASLCVLRIAKDLRLLYADSQDFDQTEWMPRLILVFAGHTGHFVGLVMLWLISGSGLYSSYGSHHISVEQMWRVYGYN